MLPSAFARRGSGGNRQPPADGVQPVKLVAGRERRKQPTRRHVEIFRAAFVRWAVSIQRQRKPRRYSARPRVPTAASARCGTVVASRRARFPRPGRHVPLAYVLRSRRSITLKQECRMPIAEFNEVTMRNAIASAPTAARRRRSFSSFDGAARTKTIRESDICRSSFTRAAWHPTAASSRRTARSRRRIVPSARRHPDDARRSSSRSGY